MKRIFWNLDSIESLNLYSQWESNPHTGKQAYNLSFSEDTWEYALQLANVLVLDFIDIG